MCLDSGYWPAYTNEAVTVSLNSWESSELEQLEAELITDMNMERAA